MDEIDSLLDNLILRRKAANVPYVDDKYGDKIKLKDIPSKGQGIFAERALSIRDPVCDFKYPTMLAIDSDNLKTTCYHCLIVTAAPFQLDSLGHTSLNLQTCGGCNLARFCNRDCQTKSWHAYHKYECKIFKKMRDNLPPAIFRAVMRMVLLKDRDLVSEDEWLRTISLESHENITATAGRSNLSDMAVAIQHLTQTPMKLETLQTLIFVMKFNAIELPTPIYGGIGVMLIPLVAKFNHSCEPNVALRRPLHTMASGWNSSPELSEDQKNAFAQFVPLRDIETDEELLTCYVPATVSVEARKARLREDYFFDCQCPRCVSDAQEHEDFAKNNLNTLDQFQHWMKGVTRQFSRIDKESSAFRKASTEMDNLGKFSEFPVLYTSGDFPEVAMTLVASALKRQAFDEALIELLRIHLLVNPPRFVGRQNPTHIYTTFLLLDVFNVLTTGNTPAGINAEKVEDSLKNLQTRGLSKQGLIYWQNRICSDLKKRLETTPAKDLLALSEKRNAQTSQNGDVAAVKQGMEEEMRSALKLGEADWAMALQQTEC